MDSRLNKFKLLMWKNFIILQRQPTSAFFEITVLLLVSIILIFLRTRVEVKQQREMHFETFFLSDSEVSFCNNLKHNNSQNLPVAYSPNSKFVTEIVKSVCPNIDVKGFNSTKELNKIIDNNVNFYAAIQFDDALSKVTNVSNLPSSLHITLRLRSENDTKKQEWYTNDLYPEFQHYNPRAPHDPFGGQPQYAKRGFLFLQKALTLALMINITNKTVPSNISMKRYPHPKWLSDQFYESRMAMLTSLLLMIGFLCGFVNTLREMILEKERQLKEALEIMGLPWWLQWLAWFMRTFIIMLGNALIFLILAKINFKNNPVFAKSEITVFTTNFTVNLATTIGQLVFFLSLLPAVFHYFQFNILTSKEIISASVLPNCGLFFGISLIFEFEAKGEGIHWSNLMSSPSPDDDRVFGAILLMLLFDTFLYLIIAVCVEMILRGDFKESITSWYFRNLRVYRSNKVANLASDQPVNDMNEENFEELTTESPVGIEFINASKNFGSNSVVKNLNLKLYENHVNVLLGHDGAGKTTTISMITGMIPPSSGTAVVNNFDVKKNLSHVRSSMGICPQNNVLFDKLTVWEHLYFFCKLKGLQKKETIVVEINKFITSFDLESEKNAESGTLSGGMKRKLSVAVAMCGRPKVVLLDEPTTGIDIAAKRNVWNMIQKQKQGRTILVTTHIMDEANLLGDRIAIMENGELQCCGSSSFLKKKYGTGYYLIMDVFPQCIPNRVTKMLKKYIPDINIYSRVGNELTYQLSASNSSQYERMLGHLEANMDHLKIRDYRISLTTLEEVFMRYVSPSPSIIRINHFRVGANQDQKTLESDHESKIDLDKMEAENFKINHLEGYLLLRNQFAAMVYKKFLSTLRTWPLLLIQIVLPILFFLLAVVGDYYSVKVTSSALTFNLEKYTNPVILLSGKKSEYYKTYKRMLSKYKISEVDSIAQTVESVFVKSFRMKDMPLFRNSYIVGATFKNNITAWFNADPYHSTPLALSLVLNTLYKVNFDKKKSINFINHPLPLSLKTQVHSSLKDSSQITYMTLGANLKIATQLGFGMMLAVGLYIVFYIRERACKCKHLQFVSGVNVTIFWLTSFFCDLIIYFLIVGCLLITVVIVQQFDTKLIGDIGLLILVLFCFGLFVLPFIYSASHLFSVPSKGLSTLSVVGFIAVGLDLVNILTTINSNTAQRLHRMFLFIPFYSLAKGIYDVNFMEDTKDVENYYSLESPGIGGNITVSILMFVFLLSVLTLGKYLSCKIVTRTLPVPQKRIDEDVMEENETIRNCPERILNKNYVLVIRDLTKHYTKTYAVNGICLGVRAFECFGLLGVNGTGKSTIFKMLTGEMRMSYGTIWVKGLNLKNERRKINKLIGYCPQSDALLDELTARETLKMFALIRGVPHTQCNKLEEKLAQDFDFYQHLDKKVKELCSGSKRKLSVAVATVGEPPVIYLDEPTSSMDAVSKRYIWTTICKLRDKGKCILLASHSMEECEALCTRVAIMVNGNFQCLGSVQRLKDKFAQGYSLKIELPKIGDEFELQQRIAVVDNFIRKTFPGAKVDDRYQELILYHLAPNKIPWSKMFGILERCKLKFDLEDYSLSQYSLE
ncbi:ABC tran and/or AAA 21 domain containing protein, partial [Asbolus verrucosus]